MSTVRVTSAIVSTEASPSNTRTVTGSWDLIPAITIPEAGPSTIIAGSRVPVELPTSPPQASTHSPHQPLQQCEADPFDDFFGVSRSSPRPSRVGGTHESRHDTTLPSYHYGEELPAYSRWDEEAGPKEPPTLAMYMFKYGFLFPVFWIIGSTILCIPLRAPAEWEPTKSREERAELIAHMRQTEMKWARRCLIALVLLIISILVIALAIWSATRS